MSGSPLRVLLVEDDEEDFMIARELFDDIQYHAYQLDWVEFYDDALTEIKRQRHDVYLLDYHLGARDGLELLGEAIAAGCCKPMIMLTGQGGHDVDVEAMRAGAYDYMVKGQITPGMLERSIRYAIEHAKSTDALRETVRITSALLTVAGNLDHGVAITDPLLPEEPLGRNPSILQGIQTNPRKVQEMRETLGRGEPYEGVITIHRADGSPLQQHISTYPVRDKKGIVVQRVSICREV